MSSVSSQQAHVVHPNEPRTAETQKHQRQGAIWQLQVAVLGWGPFCRWGISFQSCQGSPGPLRRKPLRFRCLNRDQPPPKLCRAMSSALLTQLPTHVLLYAAPAFLPGVWKRLIQQISETRAASHRTPNAHLCGPRASLCAFSSLVLGSDSCVSPQGRSTREMGLRGRVGQRGVKGRGPGPSANGRNGGSSPGPRWGEGRGGRAAPRLPALLLPGSRRHGCRRAVGEDRPHCPQRGLNAGALPAPHRWGRALVAPGREGCWSGPVRAVPAGRRRCTTACPASAGCGVALGGVRQFWGLRTRCVAGGGVRGEPVLWPLGLCQESPRSLLRGWSFRSAEGSGARCRAAANALRSAARVLRPAVLQGVPHGPGLR